MGARLVQTGDIDAAAALADTLAASLDVLADANGIAGLQAEAEDRVLVTFAELGERLTLAGLDVGAAVHRSRGA
ncbi:MAG TPA: hypothetical protein VII98_04525 [Solirubrobacteraceae bacterium]